MDVDETTFIQLYKSMVHPNSVWCPYKMGDITDWTRTHQQMR